jgi:triosephosphate isomerase
LICVGESLEQRESGMTDEVITSQLKRALSLAQLDQPFVVAYEPVWAIGTGKVATAGQADAAHGALRKLLADLGGDRLADITSILYGGSVKLENAHELASCAEIDGFLIGGAALDPALFGLLCGARL